MWKDSLAKLRLMLQFWLAEIKKGSVCADLLMQHISRWIASSSSMLYDPMLHKLVHLLARRMFSQILRKFK